MSRGSSDSQANSSLTSSHHQPGPLSLPFRGGPTDLSYCTGKKRIGEGGMHNTCSKRDLVRQEPAGEQRLIWKHAAGCVLFAYQRPFVKVACPAVWAHWWGGQGGRGVVVRSRRWILRQNRVTCCLIGAQVEDGVLIGDLLQKSCVLLRFIFLLPSILFPNSPFQDLANSLQKKKMI